MFLKPRQLKLNIRTGLMEVLNENKRDKQR